LLLETLQVTDLVKITQTNAQLNQQNLPKILSNISGGCLDRLTIWSSVQSLTTVYEKHMFGEISLIHESQLT